MLWYTPRHRPWPEEESSATCYHRASHAAWPFDRHHYVQPSPLALSKALYASTVQRGRCAASFVRGSKTSKNPASTPRYQVLLYTVQWGKNSTAFNCMGSISPNFRSRKRARTAASSATEKAGSVKSRLRIAHGSTETTFSERVRYDLGFKILSICIVKHRASVVIRQLFMMLLADFMRQRLEAMLFF